MENVEPNLPLLFNMHNTSHSGFLTSFSFLSDYNIFVEDKPDKISEGRWHSIIRSKEFDSTVKPPVTWEEVLTAALYFVEPRKVHFSTGKRVPLFKRAKVVTKIVSESAPASTAAIPVTKSAATAGKTRPTSAAPSRLVLSKRTKTLAHKLPR
ncbi:hypothetical protein LIER_40634 [Lithospermum erythrorhizon]|uniref:Uncharacterized protein n=1 Tax=Lithospermum erythrorhizon TaxID=34254 RepID=A0AAV3QYN4_LITER